MCCTVIKRTSIIVLYSDLRTSIIVLYSDLRTSIIVLYSDLRTSIIVLYSDLRTSIIVLYSYLRTNYRPSVASTLAAVPDRLAGIESGRSQGSIPACAGTFSGSSHTRDLKIGTLVATLPGAWHYRVSAGTGRPGVSKL